MNLSSRTKVVAVVVGFVLVASYLIVLDLGLYAGRVHRGMSVAGHDVGGLTFPELVDDLEERQAELMDRTFTVTTDGASESVTPEQLGWNPQPFATALALFELGRGDALTAAGDRLQGWFGGVDVDWAGGVRSSRVGRLIVRLEANGVDVDDAAVREIVRRAVASDGSVRLEVPLEEPG
jgi:hypothetical protein